MDGTTDLNRCTGEVIDAAILVHRILGPGLLESAYEACLAHELRTRGLDVRVQQPVPLRYKDVDLDVGYRIDLLVQDRVVVELKTVERLLPIHDAQVLSYLKLSGRTVGLLINFRTWRLSDGVRRLVNRL